MPATDGAPAVMTIVMPNFTPLLHTDTQFAMKTYAHGIWATYDFFAEI
jgi:hypothetical protein